eukprot:GHVU01065055.1.p1 GENE.GHVU01065055.1~~GHVU01065055.1.p1  ORF type:complete len:105 (+),score=5.91 GHVU01065055.1:357-671(+)
MWVSQECAAVEPLQQGGAPPRAQLRPLVRRSVYIADGEDGEESRETTRRTRRRPPTACVLAELFPVSRRSDVTAYNQPLLSVVSTPIGSQTVRDRQGPDYVDTL